MKRIYVSALFIAALLACGAGAALFPVSGSAALNGTGMADTYMPESNVIAPPAMSVFLESAAQAEEIAVSACRPSNLIIRVTDGLNVVNSGGEVISTVSAVLEKIEEQVIPAFLTETEAQAAEVTAAMASRPDCLVISKNKAAVKRAADAAPHIRGAVIFGAGTPLKSVMSDTNSAGCKLAILEGSVWTKEAVEYLQNRFISVWLIPDDSAENIYAQILTGANGIISARYGEYFDAFTGFAPGTQLRKTVIIGHRGVPGLPSPENTLAGAKSAYEAGADMIENDIYITTDNKLVIMHDQDVSRTTDGSGNIEDMTLAQVKQLSVDIIPGQPEPVPTLEEYFIEFLGKNVVHAVEIKSAKPGLVDVLNNLIELYGVHEQVVVISFDAAQLNRVNNEMPWCSTALLTHNNAASDDDIYGSLYNVIAAVNGGRHVYSPADNGLVGKGFLSAASHRGIQLSVWTVNDTNSAAAYIKNGLGYMTTNYAQWFKSASRTLAAAANGYSFGVGETVSVSGGLTLRDGTVKSAACDITVIAGGEHLSESNGVLTAKSAGKVTAVLSYKGEMGLTVYSGLTDIVISEDVCGCSGVSNISKDNLPGIFIAALLFAFPVAALGLSMRFRGKAGQKP